MTSVSWPQRTDRLVLRPITDADVATISEYLALPEVYGLTSRTYASVDEAAGQIRARLTQPDYLGVALEADGQLIGNAKLEIKDAWSQVPAAESTRSMGEVGYTINPRFAGRGYASEALRGLLQIAFVELGLRRVEGGCFAMNLASRRVMEKAGMRCEGHFLEESYHHELGWVDGMVYAMLASEWLRRTPKDID